MWINGLNRLRRGRPGRLHSDGYESELASGAVLRCSLVSERVCRDAAKGLVLDYAEIAYRIDSLRWGRTRQLLPPHLPEVAVATEGTSFAFVELANEQKLVGRHLFEPRAEPALGNDQIPLPHCRTARAQPRRSAREIRSKLPFGITTLCKLGHRHLGFGCVASFLGPEGTEGSWR
jgi:hypothetical protein